MTLLNSQVDTILRHYDRVQEEHRAELDARTEEIRSALPGYFELEEEASALSAAYLRASVAEDTETAERAQEELDALRKRQTALLVENGYSPDCLSLTYDCPVCKDTGYVNGQKCACFRRLERDFFYRQNENDRILAEENFHRFNFEYYSDDPNGEDGTASPREVAREAYSVARSFPDGIGKTDNNLFITGQAGVGKTFLSHCIQKEAIDRGFTAFAFSAGDLFNLLGDALFHRNDESKVFRSLIRECDLLIIDDLGTEMTNEMVASELFRLLQERLDNDLSTIISTNLSYGEIAERYSERVLSRILTRFTSIRLIGTDIRMKKGR